jgi:3-deoxy-manno-octulosonate cytidylyltransferase (CMP-KDO synthetase)
VSCAAVIPARYASTRFPGKPLAVINGRPMIQYVYEAAARASLVTEVLVATDDERIFRAAEGFGARVFMTSPHHACGTDRIAEVIKNLPYDIIVNVQCDEPMIRAEMLDDVIALLRDDPRAHIATLMKRIASAGDIFNPNVVKVVTDIEGFALYFSRAPIPYYRDGFKNWAAPSGMNGIEAYKHIGIYGYRKAALLALTLLPQSAAEGAEKLEQLRALENGMRIKLKETPHETCGVDTPEDILEVERWLQNTSS